jgi:hypothetical protein
VPSPTRAQGCFGIDQVPRPRLSPRNRCSIAMASSPPTASTTTSRLWLTLPVFLVGYCVAVEWADDLRPEHVVFTLAVAALGYAGGKARTFMVDMTPYVLIALGYDIVRYLREAFVRPEQPRKQRSRSRCRDFGCGEYARTTRSRRALSGGSSDSSQPMTGRSIGSPP